MRNQKGRTLMAASSSLGRERSEICGDCNNVVFGKACNHFLHRRHGSAVARSILNADELPGDIDRLQTSDSGHFTESSQLVPMTACALNRSPRSTGLHQCLSLC